jgi:transcriptional regulator with GAF, ATPase, and Fis domain
MSGRLNLIPEPAFEHLKPVLHDRMKRIGDAVHAGQFEHLLDPLLGQIIESGFREAGAHEGTVWLVDAAEEFLDPAFNTGPHAGKIVGHFKQPVNSGLISMVFATEQPFLENDVPRNAQQSKLLDSTLGVQTHALIAVPFHFLHACRGVVSCVQLKPADAGAPDPPGFVPTHLAGVQRTTALVSQLIEYRLLSCAVGWACE